MDWRVVIENLPLILRGLVTSMELTIATILLSLPIGCLIAIGRLSHRRWLSVICASFVNLLRSNPLILILFWIYFSVPLFTGRPVGDLSTVLIAFTVFFSAYFAEIVRAGVQSVGTRQVQAGLSSSLSYTQTIRYIVLPQAMRAMLPALTTQCIVVFQGTTVAYIIGFDELLHTTAMVAERTVRPVELYVFVSVVYFAVCYAGSLLSRYFERRVAL